MKRLTAFILSVLALLMLASCSRAPKNTVFSASDMIGARIGVVMGTESAACADEIENADVRYYTNAAILADDLLNGVLDCAIFDADEMHGRNIRGLRVLDEPLKDASYCGMVAKENVDLTADFNGALGRIKDSGLLQDIIDGYVGGGDYRYEPSDEQYDAFITLGVDARFEPYAYYDDDGAIVGMDVDLARAVCDELGIGLEVVDVAAKDFMRSILAGRADIALGRIEANEEDMEYVDFTDIYYHVTQIVAVRKK